jgi:hypothetical protein
VWNFPQQFFLLNFSFRFLLTLCCHVLGIEGYAIHFLSLLLRCPLFVPGGKCNLIKSRSFSAGA